jgi:methyl-accepting chemotaxis protein-1 (serine sensor receptor)
MKLQHLSLKTKLVAGFCLLALNVMAVSALAVVELSKEHRKFSEFVRQSSARLALANEILDGANARAVAERNLVLVLTPEDRDLEFAAVQRSEARVGQALAALKEALARDSDVQEEERNQSTAIEGIEASYGPVAMHIVELAMKGERDEAIGLMNSQCRPLLAGLIQAVQGYVALGGAHAAEQVAAADASFAANRAWMIGACLFAVGFAAFCSWLLTRAVTQPLARAVQIAQRVAAGDLTSQIEVRRRDETGLLLEALKTMNDGLVDIVGSVRRSSDSIATGSAQIAAGNADLSQRTEMQAASLQRTSASMEQINVLVKNNADTASQATQLAESASQAAEKGGAAVRRVVATMNEIAEQSRRIADIIGVIDGIAFQTNILALNAAVEAARAGEQGRGFAVVAGEVRALAQRSAEAAKEIKALISASTAIVDSGAGNVESAGSTMEDIVAQVRRVADLMQEISTATREQTLGIHEVSEAVVSLDGVTQQNAALVEQGSAAAISLKDQAAHLAGVVSTFRMRAAAH